MNRRRCATEAGNGFRVVRQSQCRTICQVINDLGIILVFVLIQFGGHTGLPVWGFIQQKPTTISALCVVCHIDGHKGYCGNFDRKTRVCVQDHSGSCKQQTHHQNYRMCSYSYSLMATGGLSWFLASNDKCIYFLCLICHIS